MEKTSFTGGGAANDVQNKPTKEDSERPDEYGKGTYKERADQYGEAEKFGTDQLPVTHDKLPAKNLKSVGG